MIPRLYNVSQWNVRIESNSWWWKLSVHEICMSLTRQGWKRKLIVTRVLQLASRMSACRSYGGLLTRLTRSQLSVSGGPERGMSMAVATARFWESRMKGWCAGACATLSPFAFQLYTCKVLGGGCFLVRSRRHRRSQRIR